MSPGADEFRPREVDLAEFAFSTVERADNNGWSALLVEPQAEDRTAAGLISALEAIGGVSVKVLHAPAINDLALKVPGIEETVLLLSNLSSWSMEDWRQLDRVRTRLEHKPGQVVLLLTAESAANLFRFAPNLLSWLSGIYRVKPGPEAPPKNELDDRLASLRERYLFSDTELVDRAMRGDLPRDPEIAEWLVLIGRGDLIGP